MRLNKFHLFSHDASDLEKTYFNEEMNKHYFEKASKQSYIPTNELLLKLLREHKEFKINLSITGTFLEQCNKFNPLVLKSFQELFETGKAEVVAESYYHSLASLFNDSSEFWKQVELHKKILKETFNQEPRVFRNTELIYNNRIAREAEEHGFSGILAEGIDWVLGWRSPNYLYKPVSCKKIKVFLRNYRLSDDIGYRFANRNWIEYPLTADKYSEWLSKQEGNIVNIFMDYETFGEHHWSETGIFSFLKNFPKEVEKKEMRFSLFSEAINNYEAVGEIDVHSPLSWADLERNESAWLGNRIQKACFHEIEKIGELALKTGDEKMIDIWRKMQTSDHFYYLCTKNWEDGDVHKYFSPYKDANPYENFANFMNIIQDLREELESKLIQKARN